MYKVYSNVDPKLLLLVINRKSDIKSQRTDLCPEDQYMQISTKKLAKNTSFKPHKHNKFDRTVHITQEAWLFLSGKVKAKFWDIDDKFIYDTILKAGDCAAVFHAGHSFEVLEDDTILYEFKNGPYYGVEKDKTYIGEK
jgi:hypothetical protein